MEKNLNEILNRDDYKKLTKQLKERVEKIACAISTKMFELDIEEDMINIDNVCVTCRSVRSSIGDYDYLAIARNTEYGTEWYSLEDVNHSYYYCNDFNARVHGCTNKEALLFLNVASKIIEYLGVIEEKQVLHLQQSLDNTKGI